MITDQPNLLRDTIWNIYATRSSHQIEVEREYVCKFEFALRRRCLSSERLKRLDAEIYRGRSIRTISLDCIPWVYDQHPIVARPPSDFPWYAAGEWIWLSGEWYLQTRPGTMWSQPGVFRSSLARSRSCKSRITETSDREDEGVEDGVEMCRGPLDNVPYLVYLGTDDASQMWTMHDSEAAEFAL